MNRRHFLVRAIELVQVQPDRCFSRKPFRSFSACPVAKVKSSSDGMSAGKSSTNLLKNLEIMWRDLFSDPSQWWDNRAEKTNPRFPDFKHKQSGEALWVIDGRNPPWVVSEIARLAPGSSIFSVTEKLRRYNKAGQFEKTLEVFEQVQKDGINLNKHINICVLNACASLRRLKEGTRIHQLMIETGDEMNLYEGSSLVDMYAKCGSIDDAWRVFDKMPKRDAVCWNALILGVVKCGQGSRALELFDKMQQDGVQPNPVTYLGLLNACASLGDLEHGKRVHRHIIRSGCEWDEYVANTLLDMYSKCGSLDDAWTVFNKMSKRDVVGWTTMILGVVKCGQGKKALELFEKMQQEGVQPNSVTFVAVLNACASIEELEEGKRVHRHAIRSGCECNEYVANTLVDMYAKCGSIEDAWRVFDKMREPSVVAWNTIILGFVKCGQGLKALELFRRMQQEQVEPNSVTFVGVLNACASVAALEAGKHIHRLIMDSGLELDLYLSTALIDMYAKCGSLDDAAKLFDKMFIRDVTAWTVMIMGYAMHGRAKEAVNQFEQMFRAGLEINAVTFICVLSACSHGGLVKEGMQLFDAMTSVYGVSPTLEHYICMVDLLGRSGHLDDAEEMVNSMPFEPTAVVWMALLSACKTHGNVEMGERASKRVLELDSINAAGYVLLSDIYAAAGDYESKALVQDQRLKQGAVKQAGQSWIEVNNKVHSFVANDCQHPQMTRIHEELERLSVHMKDAGYVPDLRFALHDVEDDKKAGHLCCHSEKLAIGFGLISTPAGTPLRIAKNLRVCGDCHTATKFITNIVGREIIVRDANRFHHFKDGVCSCRDFW